MRDDPFRDNGNAGESLNNNLPANVTPTDELHSRKFCRQSSQHSYLEYTSLNQELSMKSPFVGSTASNISPMNTDNPSCASSSAFISLVESLQIDSSASNIAREILNNVNTNETIEMESNNFSHNNNTELSDASETSSSSSHVLDNQMADRLVSNNEVQEQRLLLQSIKSRNSRGKTKSAIAASTSAPKHQAMGLRQKLSAPNMSEGCKPYDEFHFFMKSTQSIDDSSQQLGSIGAEGSRIQKFDNGLTEEDRMQSVESYINLALFEQQNVLMQMDGTTCDLKKVSSHKDPGMFDDVYQIGPNSHIERVLANNIINTSEQALVASTNKYPFRSSSVPLNQIKVQKFNRSPSANAIEKFDKVVQTSPKGRSLLLTESELDRFKLEGDWFRLSESYADKITSQPTNQIHSETTRECDSKLSSVMCAISLEELSLANSENRIADDKEIVNADMLDFASNDSSGEKSISASLQTEKIEPSFEYSDDAMSPSKSEGHLTNGLGLGKTYGSMTMPTMMSSTFSKVSQWNQEVFHDRKSSTVPKHDGIDTRSHKPLDDNIIYPAIQHYCNCSDSLTIKSVSQFDNKHSCGMSFNITNMPTTMTMREFNKCCKNLNLKNVCNQDDKADLNIVPTFLESDRKTIQQEIAESRKLLTNIIPQSIGGVVPTESDKPALPSPPPLSHEIHGCDAVDVDKTLKRPGIQNFLDMCQPTIHTERHELEMHKLDKFQTKQTLATIQQTHTKEEGAIFGKDADFLDVPKRPATGSTTYEFSDSDNVAAIKEKKMQSCSETNLEHYLSPVEFDHMGMQSFQYIPLEPITTLSRMQIEEKRSISKHYKSVYHFELDNKETGSASMPDGPCVEVETDMSLMEKSSKLHVVHDDAQNKQDLHSSPSLSINAYSTTPMTESELDPIEEALKIYNFSDGIEPTATLAHQQILMENQHLLQSEALPGQKNFIDPANAQAITSEQHEAYPKSSHESVESNRKTQAIDAMSEPVQSRGLPAMQVLRTSSQKKPATKHSDNSTDMHFHPTKKLDASSTLTDESDENVDNISNQPIGVSIDLSTIYVYKDDYFEEKNYFDVDENFINEDKTIVKENSKETDSNGSLVVSLVGDDSNTTFLPGFPTTTSDSSTTIKYVPHPSTYESALYLSAMNTPSTDSSLSATPYSPHSQLYPIHTQKSDPASRNHAASLNSVDINLATEQSKKLQNSDWSAELAAKQGKPYEKFSYNQSAPLSEPIKIIERSKCFRDQNASDQFEGIMQHDLLLKETDSCIEVESYLKPMQYEIETKRIRDMQKTSAKTSKTVGVNTDEDNQPSYYKCCEKTFQNKKEITSESLPMMKPYKIPTLTTTDPTFYNQQQQAIASTFTEAFLHQQFCAKEQDETSDNVHPIEPHTCVADSEDSNAELISKTCEAEHVVGNSEKPFNLFLLPPRSSHSPINLEILNNLQSSISAKDITFVEDTIGSDSMGNSDVESEHCSKLSSSGPNKDNASLPEHQQYKSVMHTASSGRVSPDVGDIPDYPCCHSTSVCCKHSELSAIAGEVCIQERLATMKRCNSGKQFEHPGIQPAFDNFTSPLVLFYLSEIVRTEMYYLTDQSNKSCYNQARSQENCAKYFNEFNVTKVEANLKKPKANQVINLNEENCINDIVRLKPKEVEPASSESEPKNVSSDNEYNNDVHSYQEKNVNASRLTSPGHVGRVNETLADVRKRILQSTATFQIQNQPTRATCSKLADYRRCKQIIKQLKQSKTIDQSNQPISENNETSLIEIADYQTGQLLYDQIIPTLLARYATKYLKFLKKRNVDKLHCNETTTSQMHRSSTLEASSRRSTLKTDMFREMESSRMRIPLPENWLKSIVRNVNRFWRSNSAQPPHLIDSHDRSYEKTMNNNNNHSNNDNDNVITIINTISNNNANSNNSNSNDSENVNWNSSYGFNDWLDESLESCPSMNCNNNCTALDNRPQILVRRRLSLPHNFTANSHNFQQKSSLPFECQALEAVELWSTLHLLDQCEHSLLQLLTKPASFYRRICSCFSGIVKEDLLDNAISSILTSSATTTTTSADNKQSGKESKPTKRLFNKYPSEEKERDSPKLHLENSSQTGPSISFSLNLYSDFNNTPPLGQSVSRVFLQKGPKILIQPDDHACPIEWIDEEYLDLDMNFSDTKWNYPKNSPHTPLCLGFNELKTLYYDTPEISSYKIAQVPPHASIDVALPSPPHKTIPRTATPIVRADITNDIKLDSNTSDESTYVIVLESLFQDADEFEDNSEKSFESFASNSSNTNPLVCLHDKKDAKRIPKLFYPFDEHFLSSYIGNQQKRQQRQQQQQQHYHLHRLRFHLHRHLHRDFLEANTIMSNERQRSMKFNANNCNQKNIPTDISQFAGGFSNKSAIVSALQSHICQDLLQLIIYQVSDSVLRLLADNWFSWQLLLPSALLQIYNMIQHSFVLTKLRTYTKQNFYVLKKMPQIKLARHHPIKWRLDKSGFGAQATEQLSEQLFFETPKLLKINAIQKLQMYTYHVCKQLSRYAVRYAYVEALFAYGMERITSPNGMEPTATATSLNSCPADDIDTQVGFLHTCSSNSFNETIDNETDVSNDKWKPYEEEFLSKTGSGGTMRRHQHGHLHVLAPPCNSSTPSLSTKPDAKLEMTIFPTSVDIILQDHEYDNLGQYTPINSNERLLGEEDEKKQQHVKLYHDIRQPCQTSAADVDSSKKTTTNCTDTCFKLDDEECTLEYLQTTQTIATTTDEITCSKPIGVSIEDSFLSKNITKIHEPSKQLQKGTAIPPYIRCSHSKLELSPECKSVFNIQPPKTNSESTVQKKPKTFTQTNEKLSVDMTSQTGNESLGSLTTLHHIAMKKNGALSVNLETCLPHVKQTVTKCQSLPLETDADKIQHKLQQKNQPRCLSAPHFECCNHLISSIRPPEKFAVLQLKGVHSPVDYSIHLPSPPQRHQDKHQPIKYPDYAYNLINKDINLMASCSGTSSEFLSEEKITCNRFLKRRDSATKLLELSQPHKMKPSTEIERIERILNLYDKENGFKQTGATVDQLNLKGSADDSVTYPTDCPTESSMAASSSSRTETLWKSNPRDNAKTENQQLNKMTKALQTDDTTLIDEVKQALLPTYFHKHAGLRSSGYCTII